MEPLFFKAENRHKSKSYCQSFWASMEPLFFKAENKKLGKSNQPIVLGFNGAAFFQSGKYLIHCQALLLIVASMEPLFFKAENGSSSEKKRRRWGFNGAAFFQSGKSTFRAKSLPPPGGLQWSRFFSKRKIVPNRGSGIVLPSFNGAAFFQSGKWKARTLEQSPRSCFNGAAFFQSGKCANGCRTRPGYSRASMEPLFFKAENAHGCSPVRRATVRFNGAAFFQSGKYLQD